MDLYASRHASHTYPDGLRDGRLAHCFGWLLEELVGRTGCSVWFEWWVDLESVNRSSSRAAHAIARPVRAIERLCVTAKLRAWRTPPRGGRPSLPGLQAPASETAAGLRRPGPPRPPKSRARPTPIEPLPLKPAGVGPGLDTHWLLPKAPSIRRPCCELWASTRRPTSVSQPHGAVQTSHHHAPDPLLA